jgi:hypothetical protein
VRCTGDVATVLCRDVQWSELQSIMNCVYSGQLHSPWLAHQGLAVATQQHDTCATALSRMNALSPPCAADLCLFSPLLG